MQTTENILKIVRICSYNFRLPRQSIFLYAVVVALFFLGILFNMHLQLSSSFSELFVL